MRRQLRYSLAAALAVAIGLAVSPALAASYSVGDVLYVVYQPQGTEFVVNLGPEEQFTGALKRGMPS